MSLVGSRAGGDDVAAVRFYWCAGDGEPDPAATLLPVARGVGAVEAVEDVAEMLRGDAIPGVCDADLDPAVVDPSRRDNGVARGRAVSVGFVEQVAQHLCAIRS